ncbi:MAG: N-acetylmuramoyl-L-alanine amidase family protein [Gemmatimonadales bacterium]
MTFLTLALFALAASVPPPAGGDAPLVIVVRSSRGEARIPVRVDPEAGPAVTATQFLPAVGGAFTLEAGWAAVAVGSRSFRFLLGAQLYEAEGSVRPLVGFAAIRRDTLLLPLQFVSEILPRALAQRFRYDPRTAQLTDNAPGTTTARAKPAEPRDPDRLPNGLRRGHVVTIDAGHGGRDPGNPGMYFPRGITESDVNLAVARLLRGELEERGVSVVMTRSTDTLIDLRDRGGYCTDVCDLFVSIHVNSLPRRSGFTKVRGFETYFLAEAKTEDAARVARMENEAIRFEAPKEEGSLEGLDFLLRDLQLNEYLRESARAAELVQSYLQESHPGPDRGVRQGGLMVLTTARRPAILVELGYSTNPDDAKVLTTKKSQRNLASSIADAVVAYLKEYERKIGMGPATRAVDRARVGDR